jgi:hypothetical protein
MLRRLPLALGLAAAATFLLRPGLPDGSALGGFRRCGNRSGRPSS